MRCSALEASMFCGGGQGCVLEAFQNCSVPGCHRDDTLYETPMHVCSEDKAKGHCEDGPLREAAFSHACRLCLVLLPCPWGWPCQPPWPPGPLLRDTPHRRVWFRVVRTCQKRDRALECQPGALSGVGGGQVSICIPDGPHSTAASDKMPPPEEEREQALGWRAVWAAPPEAGLGLSLGGGREAGGPAPEAEPAGQWPGLRGLCTAQGGGGRSVLRY